MLIFSNTVAFCETDDNRIEIIRTVVEDGRHRTIFESYDKPTKRLVSVVIVESGFVGPCQATISYNVNPLPVPRPEPIFHSVSTVTTVTAPMTTTRDTGTNTVAMIDLTGTDDEEDSNENNEERNNN